MSAGTCFSVVAEPSPYVLPRVFDVLARHGVVPSRCHTYLGVDGAAATGAAMTIDLQLAEVDAVVERKIAHGLGRLVEVVDVLTGAKCGKV